MSEPEARNPDGHIADVRSKLMEAALSHVPFDGWSEATFQAASRDAGIDLGLARATCPRGAVDLALAYHAAGDEQMLRRMRIADMSTMRFRDRVAAAIRFRIEAASDKEVVRRGTTLFALPQHTVDGAKAIWGTADLIWSALGDSSDDLNWYTKRATLAAVYGATVLYWLGDDSPDARATWDFLDRRIGDVMRIEEMKGKLREHPMTKPFMAGQEWLARQIRRPASMADMPGSLATGGPGPTSGARGSEGSPDVTGGRRDQ